MKKIFSLVNILLILIVLSSCGLEEKELTRLDVLTMNKEGKTESSEIVIDKKAINSIEDLLNKTKWEPNTKPELIRREDVLITLFYTLDNNKPERLYEYRVWFNSDESATIMSNKDNEGFGKLDKDYAKELKSILDKI